MKKKLSNDIVDARLLFKNKPITRLDNYINNKTKIRWKCNKCTNIWSCIPSHILNNNSGCPRCARNNRLTNEIVDERIKNRLIKRIDDVKGAFNKIHWQCLIEDCKYIWISTPDHVVNKNTGCTKCSKRIRLTNEIVDQRILNRKIKRLNDISNAKTKINWECNICNYIWSATPNDILCGKGCSLCKNKNEKLILNILKENNIDFEYQKDIRELNTKEVRCCKIDFYVPKCSLVIEYNGIQHYTPVRFNGMPLDKAKECYKKQVERDVYISNFCLNNNYKLIIIDGRKYTNNKLKTFLLKLIKSIK